MTSHSAETARLAECIQFIDKNNTRGFLFGLFKKISDAGGSQSDEHFHELRAAETKKRHTAFTGHGFGQHGFAGTGWTHQKNTPRNFTPHFSKFLRLFKKVDHFNQFLFRFVHTSDVIESNI